MQRLGCRVLLCVGGGGRHRIRRLQARPLSRENVMIGRLMLGVIVLVGVVALLVLFSQIVGCDPRGGRYSASFRTGGHTPPDTKTPLRIVTKSHERRRGESGRRREELFDPPSLEFRRTGCLI